MGRVKRKKPQTSKRTKSNLLTCTFNEKQFCIRPRRIDGLLTVLDHGEYQILVAGLKDESDLVREILAVTTARLLEKYQHEKTDYLVHLDTYQVRVTKRALLRVYPKHWALHSLQKRNFRCVLVLLDPVSVA
jgi:hypothetical protein